MAGSRNAQEIIAAHVVQGNHAKSDYLAAIRELVQRRGAAKGAGERAAWQRAIDEVYALLLDEITSNQGQPVRPVKFGTSGWRGILGKDLFLRSAAFVTAAIVSLYHEAGGDKQLREALGLDSLDEARRRGVVVGHDNRFGGPEMALAVVNVLAAGGFAVLYAGEATTGALSAMVLRHGAAFSINLTPSHNPLDYGGFKYNAADGGPAEPLLTSRITARARAFLERGASDFLPAGLDLQAPMEGLSGVVRASALESWQTLARAGQPLHGLDYDDVLARFERNSEIVVAIDCVHGASRNDIRPLFNNFTSERLVVLRGKADPTFGGIAPEPSSKNMVPVTTLLAGRSEPLKLGAIIDPDGDRIRFTDGVTEISMNQFGAMAYHFLHEIKGKLGMVAKTVATSNLANAVALALGEEVFEPPVGFKEFKPVIGRALVTFEESDGISIIGHTPEKDAYIGLLLALDMVLTLGKNLGDYLREIEETYGHYYPDRDGLVVSRQGEELRAALDRLRRYDVGVPVRVGDRERTIKQVIAIDGRKMILDDKSWLMIRPSGTEPKVRFYVEARDPRDTALLVAAAKSMLAEIGLTA